MSSLAFTAGSVFEDCRYLTASAEHTRAEVEIVAAAGASLPLLRMDGGALRTVYGLPRPSGASEPATLAALADALARAADPAGLTAILSPLHPGPDLARLLCERGARPVGSREICFTSLAGADPSAAFHRRARRAIKTAVARGAAVELSSLTPWFGRFYRAAMAELRADPIYFFDDAYFDALADCEHYQVTVFDEEGIAAVALFLHDEREAYYHLGGRRTGRAAVVGAMTLALSAGIAEARERGCALAVLGGGRGDAADDPLFTFKRQLATETRARPAVVFEPRTASR